MLNQQEDQQLVERVDLETEKEEEQAPFQSRQPGRIKLHQQRRIKLNPEV